MAKTSMLCPFNYRLCKECPLYRGRHYYLGLCKKYRGYLGEPEDNTKSGTNHQSFDFQALEKLVKRWEGRHIEGEPKVRLKVIDMESGTSRVCELDEAKTWDWGNPEILRVVDGFHITGWDKLVELSAYKAERGLREIVVYEGPRFMLLGGG
jgi:hypothetical protein